VTASREFLEFLQDQLSDFGPVTIRRMFGGAGIFREGLMFALVTADALYFKADDRSSAEFVAEGLKPFEYMGKTGRQVALDYYRAPERCLDDRTELAIWAGKAHAAAVRAAARKSPRRKY
jgi:DNA transformation protein